MGAWRSTGTRCGPSSSLAVPPMVALLAPASYSAFASTATTTTTTLRQAHPAPLGCSHLVPPNVSSFSWPLRLKSLHRHPASLPIPRLQAALGVFSLVRVIWLTHQRIWLRADRLRVDAHNLGMSIRARLRADPLHVSCLFDGHPKSIPFVGGDDCNIGLARGHCPWARVCTR
ncbi:hypothetical protein BC826DRAFT_1019418 [Russula brevipes]|nr:hypothetical protein BC826DRAFT_1019418 [Russula brevipes]